MLAFVTFLDASRRKILRLTRFAAVGIAIPVAGIVAALIADAGRGDALAQAGPPLEGSVVFAMPGGAGQDAMQKCVFDEFTKKYNVRVDVVSIQPQPALARLLAQRANPVFDVVYTIPQVDYAGFKEGVFIPITPSLVPNVVNIDPAFAEPGRSAILMTSIFGIQYNAKIFEQKGWQPPASWADLMDPKYKGHVGISGLNNGVGQVMVALAGWLNGGDSRNFDAAFDYLVRLKPNIYTVFQQSPQFDAAVLNETIWLGVSYAGRPLAMRRQGAPISFVQPREGTVVSSVALSIVKNAPHPKAAATFVNWMLTKEAQSCLPAAGYTPSVKGIGTADDLASFLKVQRNLIPIDWVHLQDSLPDLLKRWNREMDG